MRFKLLGLFLALGFIFGGHSEVKADAIATLKSAVNKYVCPQVGKLDENCKTFCTDIASNKATSLETITACMNTLKGAAGVNKDISKIIPNVIKFGCQAGCVTFPINVCKKDEIRKFCGAICCSIAPSNVKNCMGKNNDNCDKYKPGSEALKDAE